MYLYTYIYIYTCIMDSPFQSTGRVSRLVPSSPFGTGDLGISATVLAGKQRLVSRGFKKNGGRFKQHIREFYQQRYAFVLEKHWDLSCKMWIDL